MKSTFDHFGNSPLGIMLKLFLVALLAGSFAMLGADGIGMHFTGEHTWPLYWQMAALLFLSAILSSSIYFLVIQSLKKHHASLESREKYLNTIFNTLAEGVSLNELVFDEAGEAIDYRVLEVNDAFYRTADFVSNGDVVGKLATELYGMDSATIRSFWLEHKSATENAPSEFISPISRKCFSIITSPFANNRFVTTFRDITEDKKAEAALRASEIRLRTIIEESPIAIAFGRDGVTLEVNNTYLQMFGYESATEVCGRPLIDLIAPQCRAEVADRIKKRMQGEPTASSYETLGLRRDGSQFPISITAKRLMLNDGPITIGLIVDLSEREHAEAKIHNLAFYDPLTDLPNRRLFLDRLRASLLASVRSQLFGAVLFVDMDNFKILNETQGHEYGDSLLLEVSKRIQSCVREVDTVARLGGDDFVLLLEDIDADAETASQKVGAIAEKIRASLAEVFQIKGNEYHGSSSIGVSLYRGEDMSVENLLKYSEMAMYRAKESGRNAVRFFDPDMQLAVEAHAAMEADLRRAIPEKQLRLYYQTQVDCDNRLLGAEALVRWQHPTRGLVSPAKFIPIAEESSLILEIGIWVLETACQQLAEWAKDERTHHLTIAVNVSAKQFKQIDFVEQVTRVIHRYKVNPARLKLELTESVVLSDVDDVISKMHLLKAIKVALSLDDFGTGYSSLSYLKQLPLDQIKIDQSFVRNITADQNDVVMVKTIIDMAKNFQLNVIAEGVETEAQFELLKELGCLSYQGYLFSKPRPIDEIESVRTI